MDDLGQAAGASPGDAGGREAPSGKRPPWATWNRLTKVVLSAGALASAVGAILALWPSGDPADSAVLTSVRIHPMSMSEFEFRAEKASPRAGGVPRAVDLSGDVVAAAALAHATQLATGVVTTGSTSTLSGSTTGSSSVSLPTPSPTTTLLTTATTPVTSSGSPASPLARWDFSQEAASALTDRVAPLLEVQGVTPACATDARGCRAFITTGTPVDADGDPVSVDEATREIVRLLVATRVETSPGSEGEPVGELVSADVELTGLRGESVDVLWSMFGRSARGPLPPAWQGSHLAYRLHPSSDHDTGSVSLWVPVPRAPGKYVIQLELRVDGAALDTADTRPFGGPDDA